MPANDNEARAEGLKPGEGFGYGQYVKWRREDLDPNDQVTFTPLEAPNQRYREMDGQKYLTVEVNGLACVLTIGQEITVNRIFYDAFQNSQETLYGVEDLKRKGLPLDIPPLGTVGSYQWYFKPETDATWMDQNGRPLRPGQTYTLSPMGMPMTQDEIDREALPKPKPKGMSAPKRK